MHILDTAKALRLPSSIIENVTPFEILLKKMPDYDHLKVFGCLALVNNSSRTADNALLVQKDPLNFKEAIIDPGWCSAMDVELKALEDNGTWELTSLPPGKKAFGNRQKHGVDYTETFAPVAKMVTVKSLLALAAVKGWFTCQMDVSNAFLHGDLCEEVYMKVSLGYVGVTP
ncbi:retrovirus-related pol polyprotein from transposon TNT 1-94 [Tanacetum coccineum]